MNKFFLKPCFLVLLALGLFFQACVKDTIDLTKTDGNGFGPEYAASLVYSTLSLKDVMVNANKTGAISYGSDGLITLVYKGNLLSLKAADVIKFPKTTSSNSFILSNNEVMALNLLSPGNTFTIKDSALIDFQTSGGIEVSTITFKKAALSLNLNYNIQHNAIIKITMPTAKLNGVPFVVNIPITSNGSSQNINQNYALDNYVIDMTNGGTTHNKFKIRYDITLTKSNNSTNIGDGITFNQTLDSIKYTSIIGYIGQQSLSPTIDTVAFTIFKNASVMGGTSFYLADPKIKVSLNNSYGVPIDIAFEKFQGYNPGSSPSLFDLTGTGVPNNTNPLSILAPTAIGQSATTTFPLDRNNSNIDYFLNKQPKNLIYKISSKTNPSGVTNYNNFVTDSSQIKIDLDIELPLDGKLNNFVFLDTVNFSLGDLSQVKYLQVRSIIDNGFPLDVAMSLDFVDSAYHVVHNLVEPGTLVMPSASVNSNGKVTSPTSKTTDFIIPSSATPNMKNAKYILIKATVNSTGNGTTNVKFYNDYHMDIKIGVKVKLDITL